MPQSFIPILQAHKNIAVWSGGSPHASADVWFLHAFADCHRCFQEVFESNLAQRMRIHVFDLPGHGASPPRSAGLKIEDAAQIWRDLIQSFSPSRPVILVGHSMAAIIATRTAQLLEDPPKLVISLEGNLTPADAYLTGQAAHFQSPEAFYVSFQEKILQMAEHDAVMRNYACSLQFADPMTLWTLGRSVVEQPDPGRNFLDLSSPKIYYWDPASIPDDTKVFLAKHNPPQRRLEGLGHWPMVKSPAAFYAALEEDIRPVSEALQRSELKIERPVR